MNKFKDSDLFQSIFQASLEGILVVDSDGFIIKANPACEQLFDYTEGELIQKKVENLIPKKFKKNHESHRATYAKNPKGRLMGQDLELLGLKKNGSQFPLEISLSPTTIDGKQVVIAFVIDITERISVKQELVVSESKMVEAQQLGQVGSWFANLLTEERSYSDEFYKICGLPPGDKRLNAKSAINFIHPEDRESAIKAVNLALENQAPYRYQKRILRLDGTVRYIISEGKIIYDKKGKPLKMFGTLQDITDQKEMKDSLSESYRKTASLVSNLQGIVYRCKNDRDWTLEYINEGCLSITGYTSKDFLEGKVSFSHITLKEDQEKVWNDTQKKLKEKKPFHLTYRIKDKKGAIKYMTERGQGIFDKAGNLQALEGFITDITEEKETEEKLKAEKNQNKAILKAIPDLMFVIDRQGFYLDAHATDATDLMLPKAEMIGKNICTTLPKELCEKIKIAFANYEKTKEPQIIEYSLTINEKLRYFEARIVGIEDGSFLILARNITSKKAIVTTLSIINRALSAASNGIVIADAQQPNLPLIYTNDAFTKMTGYTQEEALGRNCNFLQNNDRDQKEIGILKNAFNNGEACNVIVRNYRKDGALFWNDVTITPVFNKQNKITHFIGVQNEVTNKVKQESLKNQTREILELIAQDESLGITSNKIIETVEAHFKDCMATILVLDKEHKTLHKLAAPNLPKEFTAITEGITIGPKVASFATAAFLKKEVIVANIENNILWEEYKEIALKNGLKACWSFPIISSTKDVLGTFAIYSKHTRIPTNQEKEIALDMSYLASIAIETQNNINRIQENKRELEKHAQKLEKKVADRTNELTTTVEKLIASNLSLEDQIQVTEDAEKIALASKSLSSAIAKNFPNGFIMVFNSNFEMLLIEGEAIIKLGLDAMIFEDTTVDDINIFSEKQKKKLKRDIVKTIAGEHLGFEITYKNRYFSVNTIPLLDEKTIISSALFVFSDITIQKKIESDAKGALKKEQELSELKSRFISMASHEFRTPLSAILSSAILIEKLNAPGKEDRRLGHVSKIRVSVKNLVVILNDFLSLSKLEEGKVEPQLVLFDLIDFSKSLIEEIEGIKKNGQTITLQHQHPNIEVFLDPKLLKHLMFNLLSNAIKYSEENKAITLKISNNEQQLLLEVTDQGIGIPLEDQSNMFKRFFRANNATNIEGTGLGLNIVKQYTELMGGNIKFESKENIGSTFYVELPLNTNKE